MHEFARLEWAVEDPPGRKVTSYRIVPPSAYCKGPMSRVIEPAPRDIWLREEPIPPLEGLVYLFAEYDWPVGSIAHIVRGVREQWLPEQVEPEALAVLSRLAVLNSNSRPTSPERLAGMADGLYAVMLDRRKKHDSRGADRGNRVKRARSSVPKKR